MEHSTTGLVLAPDDAVDLQVHTVYSDGTWTPEALLDYLVSENFGLVAITDHDRPDTAATLQRLALEKHMPVLVAVEMTTSWHGELTDILCFGFDPEKPDLNNLAQDVQRRQRANTQHAFDDLQGKGLTFPPDEMTAILEKPSAQQPHELVMLLKRHGYDTAEKSAGKWLHEAGVDYAMTDTEVVVDAAHRCGAVCLVAHPGRGDGFPRFDAAMFDQLRRDVPIDGFEVYYPLHTPEQIEAYLEYARQHNLLISAGSDSHGSEKKPIKYRADLCRSLLERLGIQIR